MISENVTGQKYADDSLCFPENSNRDKDAFIDENAPRKINDSWSFSRTHNEGYFSD